LSPRRSVLLGILGAGLLSAFLLGLNPADLAPDHASLLVRFLSAAIRPAFVSEGSGTAMLPRLVEAIRATVVFAAAGVSLALALALPLGFLASHAAWEGDPAGAETPGRRLLRRTIAPAATAVTRLLIAGLRSIHELLWAMLLLAAIGLTDIAAVIAIALPYAGILAKIFSEMIDEAPRDAVVALRAAGASPAQVFLLGLVPRALPDMTSYSFYRFECGLRSSAVLGFFGFPTIGYHLAAAFQNLQYREVWTWLYALFLLVLVADTWSGRLRRRRSFA
jgi:phosphonate transport system permease protein